MTARSPWVLLVVALAVPFSPEQPFPNGALVTRTAGVLRHDVERSAYEEWAAQPQFDPVVMVELSGRPFASGVLVAEGWVLTAKHVTRDVEAAELAIVSKTARVPVLDVREHQDVEIDLALLRVPGIGVSPAELYAGSDEVGRLGHWVGYGRSGLATSSPNTLLRVVATSGRTERKSSGEGVVEPSIPIKEGIDIWRQEDAANIVASDVRDRIALAG